MEAGTLSNLAQIRSALALLEREGVLQDVVHKESTLIDQNPGGKLRVDLVFGSSILVDPMETVGRELYRWGIFEPELTEFFQQFLPENALFIDVGAHVGYFSLQVMSLLEPDGRVISIEPMPDTFARLVENLNDVVGSTPQFQTIESCVSDVSGRAYLIWYGPEASAFSSFADKRSDSHGESDGELVGVDAMKLDDLLVEDNDLGSRPTFIKIDAESAEFDILVGGCELIEACRPVITLEVGDFASLNAADVPTTTQLLGLVASMGYEILDWNRGKLVPHLLRDIGAYGYWNVICVPKERYPLVQVRPSLGIYD